MPIDRVATIGVYGFDAEGFVAALREIGTDVFCDIRARRGVRGRDYAFANATRLQALLSDLGIAYRHFPELAPSAEIRALQHTADRASGTAKRVRTRLSPAFVEAYTALLNGPEAIRALGELRIASSAPTLFCVERSPDACHRSLVAARLADGGIEVQHVLP